VTLEQNIIAGMFVLIGGYLAHSYTESVKMRSEYRERCQTLESKLDECQGRYLMMAKENGMLKISIQAMQVQLDDLKEKFVPEDRRRIYENG
jgi:predicted nuclease with TOPRIM domain